MRSGSMNGTGRRLVRGLSIAAVAFAGAGGAVELPATAWAGTYGVQMCAGGYGVGAFQNGWSSSAGKALDTSANCDAQDLATFGKGDGLQVWSAAPGVGSEAGAYWLDAPAGTSITGLSYAGVFSSQGGWVAHWATSENGSGDPTSSDCGTKQDCNGGTFYGASYSVPNSGLIGFGIWCDASSCAQNGVGSLFGPAGSANVFNATVTITEPSAPALTAVGGTVYDENPTGWISNQNAPSAGWAAFVQASDPAGVCALNLSVGGLNGSNDVSPNFGSARPCQTGNPSAQVALNPCQPGGLGPGSYSASASASNPAAMVSSTTGGQFNVECSGPSVALSSTKDLNAWYSGPQTVDVAASDPSGLQSLGCAVDGQPVAFAQSSPPSYTLQITQNGSHTVACSAENRVNYTAQASLNGEVKIDSQVPSVAFSGVAPAPAWVSGPQTVTVNGREPQQLSGIASVSCQLDGGGWTTTNGVGRSREARQRWSALGQLLQRRRARG